MNFPTQYTNTSISSVPRWGHCAHRHMNKSMSSSINYQYHTTPSSKNCMQFACYKNHSCCKQPTKLGAEKSHKTFFIGVTKSMPCLISQSYFYIIKLFSCYVKNTCVYNLPGFHYAPSHKSGPGAGKGLAW